MYLAHGCQSPVGWQYCFPECDRLCGARLKVSAPLTVWRFLFQRKLSQIEVEKKDLERSQVQLEKDRAALMKTLDKVRCQRWL